MDRRKATRLSKFLSLVLRHRPADYGLRMDERGFVDFDSLIDVIVAEDIAAETAEDDVREIVEGSSRPRFEIAEGRIRALYGHSGGVGLRLPEDDPPESLWHGTTPRKAARIAEQGLAPEGRAYVHLSSTEEEALSVGRRHDDDPVLVRVDTAAAREAGVAFHRATDLIWLCSELPASVCDVPEVPERPEPAEAAPAPERRRASEPAAPPLPPPGATGGVRIIEPSESEGFKRRTRKRSTRR